MDQPRLLAQGLLAELARDRRKGRQRLHSRLKKELIKQVEQAKTTVALAQLETRWFLGEDLDIPAAQPFRNAVAHQRGDKQPFTGTAGDYPNALYNQDTITLARAIARRPRACSPSLASWRSRWTP